MIKITAFFALVLLVAAVAVSATSLNVPKLHSHGSVGDDRLIQLQRCNGTSCSNCQTIVEFKGNQCHNNMRFFEHGEILRCQTAATKRQCFTESVFDNHLHTGPNCDATSLLQSAPRECGVCSQDVFGDPFKFFKYEGCGTSTVTLYRDCDWGCGNCGLILPITPNTCVDVPGHKFFRDFTFQISSSSSCSPDIRADHFFSPTCDGEPNFVDTVFTDKCYFFAGHQHRFQCA